MYQNIFNNNKLLSSSQLLYSFKQLSKLVACGVLGNFAVYTASASNLNDFQYSQIPETWQWQISAGVLNQDYKEADINKVTNDGVLNSEKGVIPVVELSVINTLEATRFANIPVIPYGKLAVSYAQGETDYNGYIKQINNGNQLEEYSSDTDNKVFIAEYDLGVIKPISASMSITPLVGVSHKSWERGLDQYTEDLSHTAVLVGMNADWIPVMSQPLSLQATGKVGQIVHSKVHVPKFGFKQSVGTPIIWQIGVNGQYELSDTLNVNAEITHESYEYDKTDTVNDLVYPGSETHQTTFEMGLGYKF